MAFRRATWEADVKGLVETLSGFSESDENQEICINYTFSNLNYHRFLDPDSHKIKRAIKGLSDKFRVHSQLEKADCLDRLVTELLSTVDDDSITKQDGCYAVISLLLLLSDHPTQHDYTETRRKAPSPEDEVDWAAILMEDVDIQRHFPDSPEWSDLSDDDDEENAAVVRQPDGLVAGQPAVAREDEDDGFHEDEMMTADSGMSSVRSSRLAFNRDDRGLGWLSDHVVEAYWRHPLNSTEISSDSRATALSHQWAEYSFSADVLGPPPTNAVLETHIVREILWTLSGVETLHLFTLLGDTFTPRRDVTVTHLTQGTLLNSLKEACHYGNIVRKFQLFCTLMTTPPDVTSACDVTGGGDGPDDVTARDVRRCRTYLAFSTALHAYLAELKTELRQLERTCMEKGLLLSGLYESLSPRFRQLSLLDDLYTSSIHIQPRHSQTLQTQKSGETEDSECAEDLKSNAEKAQTLLDNMTEMLAALDGYGELRGDELRLLLPMYIETVRPHLEMIDQLVTVGRLDDYTREFVLRRDPTIKVTDEEFWSNAYTLTTPGTTDTAGARRPLFAPVLEDLILTAKSMEILHHMGRLSDVYTADYEPLYYTLLSELTTPPAQTTPTAEETTPTEKADIESRNEDDRLLLANFRHIMRLGQGDSGDKSAKTEVKSCTLGQAPLSVRLDEVLVRRVSARCQHVSQTLFNVLVNEYDVITHLDNVRKYFLMESGDVMYDFYTDIFEKLRNQEEWCDVSYLTVLLQDCLYQHQQQASLFVHVDQSSAPRRQPVHALDCLSLVYDVTWPGSVVIGRRCQQVYNSIFTWLLQVKRAKYSLDELHYREFCARRRFEQVTSPDDAVTSSEIVTSSDDVLYHRVQLFRMKLLTFVNALHNYIMAGVLHSKGHLFTTSLGKVTDLAELMDLHTDFLQQIHTECLLTKNLILLKEAASKVLNLCLVFQARMENEGLTRLNTSDLVTMETELSRCLQFVSSFLHNLTKHSAAPHLECLADSVLEILKTCPSR